MKYKIVSDSSSDILALPQVPFASVPLHIIIGSHEFIDDKDVDLELLEKTLAAHKGPSSTACPSVGDWLKAFGDTETVFCVTITSALSGSYSFAMAAKKEYEEQFPGRFVHVIDSLSTGPEMALIIEKLQELILSGREREDILQEITAYTRRTHLMFSLETLRNLANNGRVSPAVAKLAGILGIRVVGQASAQGELQLLNKCRGEQCVLSSVLKYMKEMGYQGGKVLISHNGNEKMADSIRESFQASDVRFYTARALCSYYAEKGGLLVGIECPDINS
nr:DegV family protein [uncultured Acetatifactor sp.]